MIRNAIILLILSTIIYLFYLLAKRNEKVRPLFSYLAIIILVFYLVWRALFTLPTYSIVSTISGLALYISEVIGLIVFSIFIFLFRKKENKEVEIEIDNEFMPKVCVFICTYNEDEKLVIATSLAAKELPYSNKAIYVCDDGNRDILKQYCDKFGLNYLAREDNSHGKAGNINYALSQTNSELFMVLDADFIVKKRFIYEAIPHFMDEKVALVQYPQSFYNKDPFQLMRKSFFNEQELFMRFLEPELAKENALIHVGTNAILRRSAVEKIGGIPTKSITEDMATGILLQNEGYITKYINKPYALGVTPYKVKDLAKQRERWAQGTIQIFKYYNPFKLKGLNFMQKLCYFNANLYWYTSFQKLVYIIAPTLFMVFNIFIVRSDVSNLFLFFVPPLLMILLSFRLYIPNIRTMSVSHIYDTFVAPIHASAILKEYFKSQKKFRVTSKEITNTSEYDFKTVKTHIILTIWLVFALIIAAYKIASNSEYMYGYIITMAWTIYNLYGLLHSVAVAKTREIISDADALSINIDEMVSCQNVNYNAFQLSFNGFTIKDESKNHLFLEGEMYLFIVNRTGLEVSAQCLKIGDNTASFEFKDLSVLAANRLASYYSDQLHAPKPVD